METFINNIQNATEPIIQRMPHELLPQIIWIFLYPIHIFWLWIFHLESKDITHHFWEDLSHPEPILILLLWMTPF
jgi:hypothetical protein